MLEPKPIFLTCGNEMKNKKYHTVDNEAMNVLI